MTSLNWPDFPVMSSLQTYSSDELRPDLHAGLTVALLAVPQCIAYALLAEMNPVYGLHAALIGVIIGALFASSEIIITGPTAKVSLVVGSVLVAYDSLKPVKAVILLTVLVGLLQVVISFLGAGDLAAFVSHSVIRGFIVGGGRGLPRPGPRGYRTGQSHLRDRSDPGARPSPQTDRSRWGHQG